MAEAVRETVAILKQADTAPLDVTGYGTLAEREADGQKIDVPRKGDLGYNDDEDDVPSRADLGYDMESDSSVPSRADLGYE